MKQLAKPTRKKALLLLAPALLIIILLLVIAKGTIFNKKDHALNCWIVNGDVTINAVLRDGKTVLTVPHDMETADVVVYFDEDIAKANAGVLSDHSLAGAFAEASEVILTAKNGTAYTVVLDPGMMDAMGFSCFTYDSKGNQIDAYWSDKDDIWYLFVPSTVSVSDVVLSYTGSISAVSEGKLDESKSTVTGAFSQSGDVITMKLENGVEYTVQVMQSGLPAVHVVLNEKTLGDVHADKDAKHNNSSVYVMDPSGTYDLDVEDSVEVKGRGNSTWLLYDKKGYQIKFDDKTSVLGMGKAKKWVLLANAGDDSMMRTTLTYRMAENLDMAFVPDMEYVDLWINGEYRGTYLIGDKVEPGSSRLNLEEDLGVLIEQDEAYYAEEDYWFFSEYLRRHFVMKEIVEEEDAYIETAMADFEASVDELAAYLYFTPPAEATLEDLAAMVDVDSFIKYYLISEYVQNKEAVVSSFYWYKDGPEDVIHMGPIWDYDTCMGNDTEFELERYSHNYMLFYYLLAIPEFHERTLELKEIYWPYLTEMDSDTAVIKDMIEDSAAMNYLRWDSLGTTANKDGSCFADSFEEAVGTVQKWLAERENNFVIRTDPVVYTSIDDEGETMELYFADQEDAVEVYFGVWGNSDGQNDLKRYDAYRDNGILRATVDLLGHNETGSYTIHVYVDGKYYAGGLSYVEKVAEPKVKATVNADCTEMEIKLSRIGEHERVLVPVWSMENGQDDFACYTATRNEDGTYSVRVNLRNHNSAGNYLIHVYAEDLSHEMIADGICFVEEAAAPSVIATVNADCTEMEIRLSDICDYDQVLIPVWSVEDGQDDFVCYTAIRNADGTYNVSVDLREHNSAGDYIINVYDPSASEMIAQGSCYVEKAVS